MTANHPAPDADRGRPVIRWLRAVGFYRGFLLVSFIPVAAGAAAAWNSYSVFSFSWLAASLVAVWCYHAGANLLNDYYDHLSGADDINEIRTPFSGGTHVIQDGLLAAASVRNAAWIAYAVGTAIFIALAAARGPLVLAFAAAGAASGILYSARPVWLSYRGVGEIVLGLCFGPFLAAFSSYMQAGRVSGAVWFVGVSLGLWSAAIITVNEVPDYIADRKSGKKNLVVRFGVEAGMRIWAGLLWSSIVLLLIGATMGVLPVGTWALVIVLAPLYKLTRAATLRPKILERVVEACRDTILGQIALWLFLTTSFLIAGPKV